MNDELNERRRSNSADGSAPPGRSSMPMPGPDDHFDAEVLAGYLDRPGDLPHEERVSIETHLATCQACRETLAELRAVIMAMSALPEAAPPRSFALTPEMVGSRAHPRPVPAQVRDAHEPIDVRQTSAWQARQMRAVRWATVAAAVLFVFVLSADIVSNRFDRNTINGDQAPAAVRSQEMQAPTEAAKASEPEGPAAAQEDASTEADALRTTGEEQSATPAPAAAYDPEQAEQDDGGSEDQSMTMSQDAPPSEVEQMASEDDRRSMSTPGHYWRLAQVGLALLIVWLLAAMIVLPRWNGGNRR